MWLPGLWWSRPTSKDEESFLATCQGFNYDEKYVGATREAPFSPGQIQDLKKNGFSINHSRVKLGSGLNTFIKGKNKLQNWELDRPYSLRDTCAHRHVQLGSICVDPTTQIKVGAKFGLHVHELVAWLINPLQILYVIDNHEDSGEQRPPSSKKTVDALSLKTPGCSAFAFAGGTLEGHLLAGEERFAVEWNKEDDTVWYDIFSFSKPAHFLSIAGFPIVKFQQHQFAKSSSEQMVKEVSKTIS